MKTKLLSCFSLIIFLLLFTLPSKTYSLTPQTIVSIQNVSSINTDTNKQETIKTATNSKEEISKNSINHEIPKNAPIKFVVQVIFLLVIIYFGIKKGGVSLGLLGGFGVAILVFVFRDIPGMPPIDVMLIILAVVTTSSTLEATGALGMLVKFAEKILRKNPKYIVYLAPISTFLLTMLVGTGHAVYPLLPVIYDIAYKQKIRPERPMAVASIASQMGITASPIAAASAAMISVALASGVTISLLSILIVTIPSCFIGMILAATWSLNRGKDLDKDPVYLEKMKDPEQRAYIVGNLEQTSNETPSKDAKVSLSLFFLGILFIIIIALFPDSILPKNNGKPLAMTSVLQFVMLGVGAVIVFCTKVKAKAISDTKVFNAGMIAVIMIFGIAWMSETVIKNNESYLLSLISDAVRARPWTFAIAMFCVSMFLKSQAATILVMMPLGFMLNIPIATLIGCIPASYAYFFFAFYPSDLATINFDRTGTTHIGKYILNHSFMVPGLIGVISATIIALSLSNIYN
ncbi:anaerobic C4-dicarboxylate transporter [Apibacter muscae]|uniref:Anaerobic C4-dicarboxylate transporter n=1 Tax=Apibacter muscae TaxID=2509004 RepID=A0A563DF06_9FLAO|nr:anaerobic C4-dicarboxylate transporter [Apibacter muscae]TWP28790.1 anaerobic C4-dicarboxylate transporter [Apibacter muscae]